MGGGLYRKQDIWIEDFMERRIDRQIEGQMDRWMDGWDDVGMIDGTWIEEQMNIRIDEYKRWIEVKNR